MTLSHYDIKQLNWFRACKYRGHGLFERVAKRIYFDLDLNFY